MYDMLEPDSCFPPASARAIGAAEAAAGTSLPQAYRDFLAFSDGYNGEVNGRYLVLWSTSELPDMATGYDLLPVSADQVLIGSNGGPTAFGIIRGSYISLPFVAAGPVEDEIRVLADDFEPFLAAIAAGEGW